MLASRVYCLPDMHRLSHATDSINRTLITIAVIVGLVGCTGSFLSEDGALTLPRLIAPIDDADTADAVLFSWEEATAVRYHIQISADANFSQLLVDELTSSRSYHPVRDLPTHSELFWRVRSESDRETSAWSSVRRIHVVSHARLTERITLKGQRRLQNFILPDSDDYASIPQDLRNPLTAGKVSLGK